MRGEVNRRAASKTDPREGKEYVGWENGRTIRKKKRNMTGRKFKRPIREKETGAGVRNGLQLRTKERRKK